ncbi:MAG: large conductance mechanosensitive channel protein MscL [Ruminococcaceae bacterium]|nr:large conductance mechanosensitive channel protein MscL [Oscillospiraceae bacterium]
MEEKKGFFSEFRDFVSRGNVIDLAVGVIIGGAFSAITASLVNDIIMPLVGLFLGGIDFSTWAVTVGPLMPGAEPSVVKLGVFIMAIINFLILALVIFTIVRKINKIREKQAAKLAEKEEEAPAEDPAPTEAELLTQILEVLKAGK